MAKKEPELLKLVAVGDTKVGKTCLFISQTTDTFPTEHVPTVFGTWAGCEFGGNIYEKGSECALAKPNSKQARVRTHTGTQAQA